MEPEVVKIASMLIDANNTLARTTKMKITKELGDQLTSIWSDINSRIRDLVLLNGEVGLIEEIRLSAAHLEEAAGRL